MARGEKSQPPFKLNGINERKTIWINRDSCCFGLEAWWAWIAWAGLRCQVENGQVRFKGDVRAIIKTNLVACHIWPNQDRRRIAPARLWRHFQGVFARIGINISLGARFPISKAKCVNQTCITDECTSYFEKRRLLKSCKNLLCSSEAFHWQWSRI